MAKKKKPRNYSATEATLINVRALKKRVSLLETRVNQLRQLFEDLHRELHTKQGHRG